MIFFLFDACVDATPLIGCSTPYGTDDRHLGEGLGRPRHNCAVCPLPGSALLCNVTRGGHEDAWPSIASSTSSGTAWRHGHFCGFASGSPVRLRLRRPLAKANVFALELKSRPRPGAICRREPGDRDGSWPLSAFRTAGTTPGCFHTRLSRPRSANRSSISRILQMRCQATQHPASSGQTDATPKWHRR